MLWVSCDPGSGYDGEGEALLILWVQTMTITAATLHITQERCRGAVIMMLLLQLFYNLCSSEKWNIPYSQSSTKLPVIMSSCHHVIMSLIPHFQRFHELNNWLTNNIRTFRSALRTWTISISHEINYEGRHFLKYLVILIIKSYFFCISCL